jgi:Subtilase family
MRNWHHRIIKLNEALALIPANNRTVITVAENRLEYENQVPPLNGLNYRASSRGLFRIINGNAQKVSQIGNSAGTLSPNVGINGASSHATCVAGIIAGNLLDANGVALPIPGVIEQAELINTDSIFQYILASAIDNYIYYSNEGNRIINANFNQNGFIPISVTPYTPPAKQAAVINASFSTTINTPENIALFDILFKTIKAYGNSGRGVLFIAAAGNANRDTVTYQDFAKHYSYPLIVSAVTITDEKNFEKVSEEKASYSCFGDRVDICGPSNGRKNGIYSTINLNCGEIGVDDEVIEKNITSQGNNANLTLADVNQVFPGNCVEIGEPGTVNHEVLIIKDVNRANNKIEFVNNRYYTSTALPINRGSVRIPVLRTAAQIVAGTMNRITITNTRGFGFVGQDICISNGDNVHHHAKISNRNAANNYEFNPVLPAGYNTANLQAIPGQVSALADTFTAGPNETTIFTFPAGLSTDVLNAFFAGEKVAVVDTTNAPGDYSIVRNIAAIDIVARSISVEKYRTEAAPGTADYQLFSIGYGSYTSSFGGTSAATPVLSGVAGLVYRANPDLNVLEIKHILKSTADKIDLKESGTTGRWKDAAGNNISYSSVGVTLTQATVLGSNEIFVNNPAAFSVNDAVKISNGFRSVVERVLADRLVLQLGVTDTYAAGSAVEKSNTPPVRSKYYGTGRVNARRAVQLALDWHNTVNPTQMVLKPRLTLADRMNPDGTFLFNIPAADANQTVDSPDIWVKPFTDASATTPSIAQPFNTLNTADDQKIYIRVRNQGNAASYNKDCDLRVYIAFTDEVNPAFPFPAKWYHQNDVKLLYCKELEVVNPNSEIIVPIEWKGIVAYWNSNNPLDPTTNRRKKAYLLAHIAPFDGTAADVQLNNVRNNKQLTCREIIVTHNGVNDRTAYLPGNRVDIDVADVLVEKSYDLIMENAAIALFDTIKIRATKKSRIDNSLETILYSKTGGVWSIESGNPAWITFDTPEETTAPYAGYKNAKFPHTIKVNQDQQEVKIEIVNA